MELIKLRGVIEEVISEKGEYKTFLFNVQDKGTLICIANGEYISNFAEIKEGNKFEMDLSLKGKKQFKHNNARGYTHNYLYVKEANLIERVEIAD
jgi:hypothetical protein